MTPGAHTAPRQPAPGRGAREDVQSRPRRRSRISYRLSLVILLPLLVVLTTGLVAVRVIVTSLDTVDGLAASLFAQAAHEAGGRTQTELGRATPAAELVAALLRRGDLGQGSDDASRQLRSFLTSVLRANATFAWVSWSGRDGAFDGAYRTPEGQLRHNMSRLRSDQLAPGRTVRTEAWEWEIGAGDHATPSLHETDTGYDPRTRPFYVLAAKERRRVWTPPYVFLSVAGDVPGITCAVPVFDPKDPAGAEPLGVVTVDFDLQTLSRLAATLRPSPHSEVFLLSPDGKLVAHPRLQLVAAGVAGKSSALVDWTQIDDGPTRAFAETLAASGGLPTRDGEARQVRFTLAGTAYLGHAAAFAIDHRGQPGDGPEGPGRAFAIDPGTAWVAGVVAPEADFIGDLQSAQRATLLVAALALLASIAIAAWLAARIARPILDVAREMDALGRLEFDARPAKDSVFREIAQMNASLATMKHSLTSFGRYVPKDLVRELLAAGEPARLGGRSARVTVFFSDLEGFTTLAETMKPDELVAFLAAFFDEMTRVLTAHHATVDKFIGDAIMAFWGAPEPREDQAVVAVRAALACQARLDVLRAEGVAWASRLNLRIGLATGEVLVGNIGTPERLNYTVMGDVVNLAARLEGQNKRYGSAVLVSEATASACQDAFVLRPIDVVAVKGKVEGVRVWEPLCARGDPQAREAAALATCCQAGLDAYVRGDFAQALTEWTAAQELPYARGRERPLEVLRERTRALSAGPRPEGWTGVFVATTK